MSNRPSSFLAAAVLLLGALIAGVLWTKRAPISGPTLKTVGPRLVSNQTSQPLSVTGSGFGPGLSLKLGPPVGITLPLDVVDTRHAFARMPANVALHKDLVQAVVPVELVGGSGAAAITVVNDAAFPDLIAVALAKSGRVFAASITTDELRVLDPASGEQTAIPVGDGPTALASWEDPSGREWIVVVHAFAAEVHWVEAAPPHARKIFLGPLAAREVKVDGSTAFIAEHARDSVVAMDLASNMRELWRAPVAPNPRAMAVTPWGLVVGSLQTGELELLDAKSGAWLRRIEPGPGVEIIGGGTERVAKYAMGGKAPRALLWSSRLSRLLCANIGPNIGPNPERVEVSMNGGISVVNTESASVERHLGFGAGVTEGLAMDEQAGLLYAADIALGQIRVIDARRLIGSAEEARGAVVQTVPVLPPASFPTARPRTDFGVQGRAGVELHSGPRALALTPDGSTLFVLDRFTGTLARVDVRTRGDARVVSQWPLVDALTQPVRRLGQVLFFADLGRTAMSCEACHLEGHTEGVLFEKTEPMRIYRSTTLRGSRETPPYFTPASTQSLAETVAVVGGRNRFHNPNLLPAEVEALTAYTGAIVTLPNPFVSPKTGAPVDRLELPDGKIGNPRAGLALFEGKAACGSCHPAPHFSADQDVATRGRYLDVGTPHGLPLRPELQDLRFEGFAIPSLLGAWDVFPMLSSGAAGLAPRDDGSVGVSTRIPLREAIERYAPKHGRADLLTAQERDDLLAYVMSL